MRKSHVPWFWPAPIKSRVLHVTFSGEADAPAAECLYAPLASDAFHGDPMVEFKAVINDPKSGKSYQRAIAGHLANSLLGKKIGDEVDGLFVQLPGYKLRITGGSDKDGFPMRADLTGPRRRGVLVSGGVGFHSDRRGMRVRRSLRGGAVSPDILQVNLKITQRGPKTIEDAWQEKGK